MSVQFSSAVWSAKIGDPVAKMVLLKLADNTNDSGKCWPTVARIAAETELSERTVQGKISTLESLGLIERSRGVNRCDYTLKLDSIICLNIPKTPRRRCTPQEMHPAGDAPYPAAPAPHTPQEMRPTPQEMQLHNREPSLNRHDEPSKNRKDDCAIDEKSSYPPIVESLWIIAVPKAKERSSKKKVLEAWQKLKPKPDEETVKQSFEFWCKCHEWTKDGGQYAPGVHRWIKDRKWENDTPSQQPQKPKFTRPGIQEQIQIPTA